MGGGKSRPVLRSRKYCEQDEEAVNGSHQKYTTGDSAFAHDFYNSLRRVAVRASDPIGTFHGPLSWRIPGIHR